MSAITPNEVDATKPDHGLSISEKKTDRSIPTVGESPLVEHKEHHLSPTGPGTDAILPTIDEESSLRRIAGPIPWIAFILCFVEFAERASYYGATQVFNNFLQFPLPDGIKPTHE
jgi:hypothetical protein